MDSNLPSTEPEKRSLKDGGRSQCGSLWWLLSLFFTGLGAKFWLINRFGTAVPFADQWEDEATSTYIPYLEGHYPWINLFSAWRLHRIFFTRTINLGLLLLNGQWDNRLEIVVNAVLHCLMITCIALMMVHLLGKKYWPMIWLPLALALASPFSWENTLWGFQSQHYFLLFFSVIAIRLLAFNPPFSRFWWLGVMTAVAALFTMASGFFAVLVAGILVVAENLRQQKNWRAQLPTLLVCAVILFTGAMLKPNVPAEYSFQAVSLKALLIAFGKNLAWPLITQPWFAMVNLFPLVLLGSVYFRSRELMPGARMILGIGLWLILQDFGLAYGRGKNGVEPVSRYMDLCNFISILDLWSIALLLTHYRLRLPFPRIVKTAFALWALSSLAGLGWVGNRVWQVEIPAQYACQQARLTSMHTFLATDDVNALALDSDCYYLPIDRQARLLHDANIQRILPDCLRTPLVVAPNGETNQTFISGGISPPLAKLASEKSWGSFSAAGSAAQGEFTSLPINKPKLPYLEIPVIGDLGETGLSLELIDLNSGKITLIKPAHSAAAQWTTVTVHAPANSFKVIARDASGTKWFAFQQPRELGRLSFWAMNLLSAWKIVLTTGLLFLAAALVKSRDRREPLDDGPLTR